MPRHARRVLEHRVNRPGREELHAVVQSCRAQAVIDHLAYLVYAAQRLESHREAYPRSQIALLGHLFLQLKLAKDDNLQNAMIFKRVVKEYPQALEPVVRKALTLVDHQKRHVALAGLAL